MSETPSPPSSAGFPQATYLVSATEIAGLPAPEGPEIAFSGRSNAGKSSAINAIVGQRNLARTSKTPGRTQMINFFDLDGERRLVDLPGYGFARVPVRVRKRWDTLLSHYFASRDALRAVFVIADIRRGLTDFDHQMIDFADPSRRRVAILLSKVDKLKRGQAMDQRRRVRQGLDVDIPIIMFSAVSRDGVDAARSHIRSWL